MGLSLLKNINSRPMERLLKLLVQKAGLEPARPYQAQDP
jgi:hypothetical protein